LEQVRKDFKINGEIRGRGLMVGFELSDPGGKPDVHITQRIQKKCLDKGLLVVTSGSYGNIFRFLPPLIISKNELNIGIEIFVESLQETLSKV
jgi:4-aminobutyrate aminotransferase-like enzyme